tara:strand:+ start:242 stop:859 length:618 start_codon:yes stop_codon:yes gene_type:complete
MKLVVYDYDSYMLLEQYDGHSLEGTDYTVVDVPDNVDLDLWVYKHRNKHSSIPFEPESVDPTIWDTRYLALTETVASWSKDPSSKFGSVLVDPNNVVSALGFNGFAKGFEDSPERWADREFKYAHVIHAEEQVLLHSPVDLTGYTLYCNGLPCSSCMSKLAQKGVSTVVFYEPTADYKKRWSIANPVQVAKECGIQLKQIRRETK